MIQAEARCRQLKCRGLVSTMASARPETIILCERISGIVKFRVAAGPDREIPVDRLAAILAFHCIANGQFPEDYEVLAPVAEPLASEILRGANALLAEQKANCRSVRLSPRQEQVLAGVVEKLQNKEIADRSNISLSCVKFHISNLFQKFGVHTREELAKQRWRGV